MAASPSLNVDRKRHIGVRDNGNMYNPPALLTIKSAGIDPKRSNDLLPLLRQRFGEERRKKKKK